MGFSPCKLLHHCSCFEYITNCSDVLHHCTSSLLFEGVKGIVLLFIIYLFFWYFFLGLRVVVLVLVICFLGYLKLFLFSSGSNWISMLLISETLYNCSSIYRNSFYNVWGLSLSTSVDLVFTFIVCILFSIEDA